MIIKVGYINNLVGTVIAGCALSTTMGNLNSWSSPVVPMLQSNTSNNPFDTVPTTSQTSWMSSLLTVGAVLGCWIYGYLADTFGRRIIFVSLGVPFLFGYVLMIAIPKVEVFLAARFIQGLAMGGGFNLFLPYLAEICSKEIRGVVLALIGMVPGMGMLYCYLIGSYVSVTALNASLMIFPILFLATGCLFCEESPYYYLMKDNEELARKALKIYRGPNANFEEDIIEMKNQIREQKEGKIMDIIKTKGYLKASIIANVLIISQQLTGINGILMYSQTIFDLIGTDMSSSTCSIILASMQVISGAISPIIVPRFKKRPILITSGIGMAVSEAILGIFCVLKKNGTQIDSLNFLPLLCLTGFMLFYNFGCGPLCWVISGEVFPIRVKVVSISFTISIYMGIGFLIAQYFSDMVDCLGIGILFLFFSGCSIATCVFVKLYVIETKDISLEEIQDILNKKNSQK